jgi:AcrR family transcriptional regulator
LLAAATTEFAQRGIAGARVDRIADLAGCSKALIYDYFGNKDQLFDVVYNAMVVTIMQEVSMDAVDLADYAGRLFDAYIAHPEILRLSTWDILERGGMGMRLEEVRAASQRKIAAIKQAQRDHRVSDQWKPEELLALILSICKMWLFATPTDAELSASEMSARRHTITEAVRCLVAGTNTMGREP